MLILVVVQKYILKKGKHKKAVLNRGFTVEQQRNVFQEVLMDELNSVKGDFRTGVLELIQLFDFGILDVHVLVVLVLVLLNLQQVLVGEKVVLN